MSNPFTALRSADFQQALLAQIPPGPAFTRDPNSFWAKLAAASADGFAVLHGRTTVLTEIESDPLQTVELLPDWELDWGLPDPCLPLDAAFAQRRAALLARINGGADPTPAFFVALALSIGYVVTVTAATSGYGAGWQHVWYINAPTITSLHAHAGSSVAGDFLEIPGNTFLECVIRRAAPAHSIVLFNYI